MTYAEIKKNMPEEYEYVANLDFLSSLQVNAAKYIRYQISTMRNFFLVLGLEDNQVTVISHPSSFSYFRSRKMDKLRYRYPRGESYLDVIQRFILCYEHYLAPCLNFLDTNYSSFTNNTG